MLQDPRAVRVFDRRVSSCLASYWTTELFLSWSDVEWVHLHLALSVGFSSLIVKLYCFSTELVVWFREYFKGINEHCFLLRNSVFLQSNDDTAFIGNLSLLFLAFYYLFNFVLPSIFQHQVIHKENNMPVLEMILMSTTGGISEEVCFLSKDAISN
jgi:hypothetical protein